MLRSISFCLAARATSSSYRIWIFIQNSALLPRYRARRRAVSAVTQRRPRMISFSRAVSMASAYLAAYIPEEFPSVEVELIILLAAGAVRARTETGQENVEPDRNHVNPWLN